MPSVPRVPEPLPPEPTTIRQWCPACQQATPSLIIEGRTYCAKCQPDGPNWGKDDEW